MSYNRYADYLYPYLQKVANSLRLPYIPFELRNEHFVVANRYDLIESRYAEELIGRCTSYEGFLDISPIVI